MRYGPEHKDQTRSALLKAAAEQMRAHGPDGVSVAAVMKRVGLTHGGFYAHFESKDDLIAEAVSAMFVHAARRREKRRRVAGARCAQRPMRSSSRRAATSILA